MFRNCLAAAIRHLARNRLYTSISVCGLAIGLCTALIAALVIFNQYTYDHQLQGYDRTYEILPVITPPGLGRQYIDVTPPRWAGQLRQQFPQIESVSRVLEQKMTISHDGQKSIAQVYWADPNLTDALPLPVSAGDVAAALRTPDSLILSREYARRFLGRDAPIGETLLLDGHAMTVRAVISDSPPNATHARRDVIASGVSSFSPTQAKESEAGNRLGDLALIPGVTYVRVKPGTNVPAFITALPSLVHPSGAGPAILSPELVRIDRLNNHEGMHPGFATRMRLLGILGAVVLLIAGLNFVNLQTARSLLRGRESAIRSLAGASRWALIVQFLGEAVIYVCAATLIALALTECLLPWVNAFLDTGATLAYDREPWLPAALVSITALVALCAGAWPAFVQAGFRPGNVLRGSNPRPHSMVVRQGLIALQFSVLIALAIGTGVVYRQLEFATREALRMDRDQVLMVHAPPPHGEAFAQALRGLRGIRAVTRATVPFLGSSGYEDLGAMDITTTKTASGASLSLNTFPVDFDIFAFYGIPALAGRLPSVDIRSPRITDPQFVVLNETAARKFGLGSPAQAIGKLVPLSAPGMPKGLDQSPHATVLAVVPDFSLSSVAEPVPPTAYFQGTSGFDLINVRLSSRDIPETLSAIDALWHRMTGTDVPKRFFLEEQIQREYVGVLRQSEAFGICAVIAMALSCIGLFALTAAAADRRAREVGIRKALGATTRHVLPLLLWQFTKPVVWANLLAWPLAAYVMRRWLSGFAYHISLPLWIFPTAAIGALAIAVVTVSTQSVLLARARPVAALRYE